MHLISYLDAAGRFIISPDPYHKRRQGDCMDHRLFSTLAALLAACLMSASGCSQQKPSLEHGSIPSLPFSVVATGDSRANIRNASTFSWGKDLQQEVPGQTQGNIPIGTLLQEAIVATLQGKGYRYNMAPGEGDLIVTYKIALDASGTDRGLVETSGNQLQPSLNITSPDPEKYEKGTLVIEVTDSLTGFTAWRSALQGFANLELGDAERRQRIKLMVDRMLAGVPAK